MTYFFRNPFFSKIVIFDIQTAFFKKNNVLQVSNRNALENAHKIQVLTPTTIRTRWSDCYLRQGAGGMKIARNGSTTWFLR